MANQVSTYDPKKIIVTYGGVQIAGFSDGSLVDAEPNSDVFMEKIGADGEVARSRSADHTYKVTFALQQVSPSNDYLSSVLLLDASGNNGVLPLVIADLNGTSLLVFPAAWIKTKAKSSSAKEVGDRTWTLHTGQVLTENIGGNLGS